jgi:acetylglutamate kinase
MKENLSIFKIGGHVIDDFTELDKFLKDFASLNTKKILVHGGGKWVSVMSKRLGLEVKMIEGRRITDHETLEVVKMMLPGVANKNIVAGLQKYGCDALGFTGADGDMILARKRPLKEGIDYGFVGDIINVNAQKINGILDLSFTPVFTAMTHDGQGQLLNTNADTIASSLAVALSAFFETELYYCFEQPGVMLDINDKNTLIPVLSPTLYRNYKSSGVIHSGMVPKIDNAFDALSRGVSRIFICHYQDIGKIKLAESEVGTLIVNQ